MVITNASKENLQEKSASSKRKIEDQFNTPKSTGKLSSNYFKSTPVRSNGIHIPSNVNDISEPEDYSPPPIMVKDKELKIENNISSKQNTIDESNKENSGSVENFSGNVATNVVKIENTETSLGSCLEDDILLAVKRWHQVLLADEERKFPVTYEMLLNKAKETYILSGPPPKMFDEEKWSKIIENSFELVSMPTALVRDLFLDSVGVDRLSLFYSFGFGSAFLHKILPSLI